MSVSFTADSTTKRLSAAAFIAISVLIGSVNPVSAQKDARGWDGTSSSMYNSSGSGGGSSSFGAYGGPSHGSFTPFGRMPSGGSNYSPYGQSSNQFGNQSSNQSSNSSNGGGYYANTPFGNPNPKFTPPANLSFQEQQVRNKQREQLAQERASQPVNPSILQAQRWQDEWKQQHPGEPMPNAGQLQHMHMGEIQNSVNKGWGDYRQRAAAKRSEEYQLATKLDQRLAAQEGRTWNKAQFDREYDQSHKDAAQAYLNSVLQSREISDRDAERRRWNAIGGR